MSVLLERQTQVNGNDLVLACEIEHLEERLRGRLGGRVAGLQLVLSGSGLVLRGRCHTYHAKQVAQHAVMEATVIPLVANQIDVV